MPPKVVADKDPIPVIAPELSNTRALEIAAVPAIAPDRKAASDAIVEPAIEIEFKDPIEVIFGCEAVESVPAKVVAVKVEMPPIEPLIPRTITLELDAVPATAPAKNAASDPIVLPAILTEFKAPTEVIFG